MNRHPPLASRMAACTLGPVSPAWGQHAQRPYGPGEEQSTKELPLELKAIALDENRHVTFEYACKSDQVSGYKGDL